VNKRN